MKIVEKKLNENTFFPRQKEKNWENKFEDFFFSVRSAVSVYNSVNLIELLNFDIYFVFEILWMQIKIAKRKTKQNQTNQIQIVQWVKWMNIAETKDDMKQKQKQKNKT